MNKEIYILCNSPQCLQVITSGEFEDLDVCDLFTCNNAFTFFRTKGRHLNFWTDTIDITRHLLMPETLSNKYQDRVEHVFSPWGIELKNGNLILQSKYGLTRLSPVGKGASTALGALAYLCQAEDYETIYLIGYTLDEKQNTIWENMGGYEMNERGNCVYRFDKKEVTKSKTQY